MTCSNENFITLCIGIFPIFLKNGVTDNYIIKFRLYDVANNTDFGNSTFIISVEKHEYEEGSKDQNILNGTFVTKSGYMDLYVNKSDDQKLELLKYNRNSKNSTIYPDISNKANVSTSNSLLSGQYRIHSVVSNQNLETLNSDTVIQVGEVKDTNFFLNDTKHNVTLISYYDRIRDFSFDPLRKTFSWQIPFEYNTTSIERGEVTVHEEIIIRNQMLASMNVSKYNMTLNDKIDESALFNVDTYSNENKTIIHFVPDINTLFDISRNNQTDKSNPSMKFVLYLR
jgi:hypothetical protein